MSYHVHEQLHSLLMLGNEQIPITQSRIGTLI